MTTTRKPHHLLYAHNMVTDKSNCFLRAHKMVTYEPHSSLLTHNIVAEAGSFPKQGGPQYRLQNTIVLLIGTPKEVPLIVIASARPPRLAELPTVGTWNYRYTGI